MINILVVDDEAVICNSLKNMILDKYKDTVDVITAEHGMKAIEIVCAQKIDIIISDIKMPVCDGIEMIKKLKELHYDGHIIVLSGFGEYAIVREAMKLGAIDYLLKPLQSNEFYLVIDKCIYELHSQRESLKFYSDTHTESIEEKLYKNQYAIETLLNLNKDNAEAFLENYNIGKDSFYIVYAMDIFVNSADTLSVKKLWFSDIEKYFLQYQIEGEKFFQGVYNNIWIIVYFTNRFNSDDYVKGFTNKYLETHTSVSSCICKDLLDIKKSVLQCISKLDMHFYDIVSSDFPYDNTLSYQEQIAILVEHVCKYEFVPFSTKLRNLFYCFCEDKPPVDHVKVLLTNMVYSIGAGNSIYLRIMGKYKFTDYDLVHEIQSAFLAEHLLKKIIKIIDQYIEDAKELSISKDEFLIQKAKNYIDENYSKDISLNDIAEYLKIHPNYFSTLFKKKTGYSFIHYLRKIRIQEACRLMETTTMKLYEVAESVGYHDNVHFNRAFKKEKGIPPTKYKKNIPC